MGTHAGCGRHGPMFSSVKQNWGWGDASGPSLTLQEPGPRGPWDPVTARSSSSGPGLRLVLPWHMSAGLAVGLGFWVFLLLGSPTRAWPALLLRGREDRAGPWGRRLVAPTGQWVSVPCSACEGASCVPWWAPLG